MKRDDGVWRGFTTAQLYYEYCDHFQSVDIDQKALLRGANER